MTRYTNLDPQAYVELEMLGPLKPIRTGAARQRSNTYTLYRRTEKDVAVEAGKILSR